MKKLMIFGVLGLLLGACDNNEEENAVDETEDENVEVEENNDTEDTEDTEEETDESEELMTVYVEFDINDELYTVEEGELDGEFEVEEGSTVLEVMQENFTIEDDGGFITAIEGYEQVEDSGAYWMYEVNEEQPTVGAEDYELEENDEILWILNE